MPCPEVVRTAPPWRHPVGVLVLGLGGFLAGVGLLLIGAPQTDRSEDFVRSAGFAPWATVIGAQTAFWLLVAGPLWSDAVSAWRRARIGRSATAALAGALILILVVFPMLSLAREIPWLLLLVYVPAHLALKQLALRIRDHYFPLSGMPDPEVGAQKHRLLLVSERPDARAIGGSV